MEVIKVNLTSSILVFLVLGVSGVCQEKKVDGKLAEKMSERVDRAFRDAMEHQAPRSPLPFSVSHDLDAFKAEPSIRARLSLIEQASPSLSWFTTREYREVNGKEQEFLLRNTLLNLMRTTSEETKELDRLFEKRHLKHQENLLVLKGADRREVDELFLKKGMPPERLAHLHLPLLSKKELTNAIEEFKQLERKAETNLCEELVEAIDPMQFEILVHKWVNVYILHSPMSAKYLDLSDDQVAELEPACTEAFRMMQERARLYGDEEKRKALLDENYFRVRYAPFSKLKPDQFRKVARLLPGWKTCRSFSERLLALESDHEIAAKCEMTVLGDLYRTGLALE